MRRDCSILPAFRTARARGGGPEESRCTTSLCRVAARTLGKHCSQPGGIGTLRRHAVSPVAETPTRPRCHAHRRPAVIREMQKADHVIVADLSLSLPHRQRLTWAGLMLSGATIVSGCTFEASAIASGCGTFERFVSRRHAPDTIVIDTWRTCERNHRRSLPTTTIGGALTSASRVGEQRVRARPFESLRPALADHEALPLAGSRSRRAASSALTLCQGTTRSDHRSPTNLATTTSRVPSSFRILRRFVIRDCPAEQGYPVIYSHTTTITRERRTERLPSDG